MGDYGHVVTWRGIRTGREARALEVWTDALEMYEKAVANSKIESYETVLFEASAGALPTGMTICWGTEDQIDAWARDDDRLKAELRASLVCEGFAISRCIRGEAVMDGVGRFVEATSGL
jgi:hypothetical protein